MPAGSTKTVTAAWNTKSLKGSKTVLAVVDPANVVTESDESDNRGTTTVTLK